LATRDAGVGTLAQGGAGTLGKLAGSHDLRTLY
jgi:hypothetical protein